MKRAIFSKKSLFGQVSKASRLVVLSCLLVLLTACASAPLQEMSDARQSMQAATDAGAEQFASERFHQANSLLEGAEYELKARSYRHAKASAVAAKTEAMSATTLALAVVVAQQAIDKARAGGSLSASAEALMVETMAAADEGDDEKAIRLADEARYQAEQDCGC